MDPLNRSLCPLEINKTGGAVPANPLTQSMGTSLVLLLLPHRQARTIHYDQNHLLPTTINAPDRAMLFIILLRRSTQH